MYDLNEISLLIKPASGLCNMRCKYCFYADEMEKRDIPSFGIMNSETAENLIKFAYANAEKSCRFVFQGGEPTLAGIEFFRNFIALTKSCNSNNIGISFAIQTNGYVLDEEWVKLFAAEKFLVGLSLDGYKDLNDLYRIDIQGKSTYQKVMNAIELLNQFGVEFNILTVITAQTARHIEKIYKTFDKNQLNFQQYIPCLDPIGEEKGKRMYSLTPKLYGQFLKKLFDLWYQDLTAGKKPYNRYFENLISLQSGYAPEACGMFGHCTNQLVIEADGGVYPCDFYVLDDYRLGNINYNSLAEIEEKRVEIKFIEKSSIINPKCKECHWFNLCRGGCRRDRDNNGEIDLNYYCLAYQEFFEYAYPRISHIASVVSGRK